MSDQRAGMTYTFKKFDDKGSLPRLWVCENGERMNNLLSFPIDQKGAEAAQRACDALEKKKRYTESRSSEKA